MFWSYISSFSSYCESDEWCRQHLLGWNATRVVYWNGDLDNECNAFPLMHSLTRACPCDLLFEQRDLDIRKLVYAWRMCKENGLAIHCCIIQNTTIADVFVKWSMLRGFRVPVLELVDCVCDDINALETLLSCLAPKQLLVLRGTWSPSCFFSNAPVDDPVSVFSTKSSAYFSHVCMDRSLYWRAFACDVILDCSLTVETTCVPIHELDVPNMYQGSMV